MSNNEFAENLVWRSVPLGPLVLGDSDRYVVFLSRRAFPYEARRDGVVLGKFNSVAEAQRACERDVRKAR